MKHAEKQLPSRCAASASSPPPAHRLSHAIAKAPPRQIRIVHLLAPEIIKTEARHFRELVQRLTGMPPKKKRSCASSSSSTGGDASPWPPTSVSSAGDEGLGLGPGAGAAAGTTEVKMKEEAETSSSSGGEGGGFLRALELDGDGFYQSLDDYFLFSSCDMGGF